MTAVFFFHTQHTQNKSFCALSDSFAWFDFLFCKWQQPRATPLICYGVKELCIPGVIADLPPAPSLTETLLFKHVPVAEQSIIFHARMHYFTFWIRHWHILQIHGRCCQKGQNNHPSVPLFSYYNHQRLQLVTHARRAAPFGERRSSPQPHPDLPGCSFGCPVPFSNLEFQFLSTRTIPSCFRRQQ